MSNKSITSTVFPIVRALQRGREFGKAETDWIARGPGAEMQRRYIPLLTTLENQLHLFSPEELKAIASDDADVINFWLKKHGFNIELEAFSDPDDFGTASIMSVLVNWEKPGTATWLEVDGEAYRAARLEDNLGFTKVTGYDHPIAHITADNGDMVHLTIADKSDLSGLDLLEKVKSLGEKGEVIRDFGGLVFPMVDLNQNVDIEFFLEMAFQGTGASGRKGLLKIKQAMQQTKFKMNHIGAKAESAAAFGFGFESCFIAKPDHTINKPFYAWMTRDGLDVPYFAGYIDSSDWKDPGELK